MISFVPTLTALVCALVFGQTLSAQTDIATALPAMVIIRSFDVADTTAKPADERLGGCDLNWMSLSSM